MKRGKSCRLIRVLAAAIIFVAAVISFVLGGSTLAMLMHLQFGAALVSLITVCSLWGGVVVLTIAVLTFLFGRFYCAAFCPFGILQDMIGVLSPRKQALQANLKKTRLIVAGLTVGLLLGGVSMGFVLLGPYANFGAIVSVAILAVRDGLSHQPVLFLVDALIPLLVIIVLVVWKRRVFCTSFCPVGVVLGLCAKHGVYQLRMNDKCVGCGVCLSQCPSGCIDKENKVIDNERCVRCMNCASICHFGAISLSRRGPANKATVLTTDGDRREFLANGVVAVASLAIGAAGGWAWTRLLTPTAESADKSSLFILPPGARSWSRFSSKCIDCQLCVVGCPSGIIVPGNTIVGAVQIDLTRGTGVCKFDCNRCNEICPTEALLPLTLAAKQKTQIAVASFDAQYCRLIRDGIECGLCVKACPTGALEMKTFPTGLSVPKLAPEKCIGCGACSKVCPVTPKAMTVSAVAEQKTLG